MVRGVGAVLPDRVDREHGRDQGDDARDDEEEATGLGDVHGKQRESHDVLVSAARARELGVLLVPDQEQMGREHSQQDARNQQDVNRVEPGNEVGSGELTAEKERGNITAYQGDRQDDALRDAKPGA